MPRSDSRTLRVTYSNGDFEDFPDAVEVYSARLPEIKLLDCEERVIATLFVSNLRKIEWVLV